MSTFIAVTFSLMLGIALGVVGIPLAVWVGAALYRADTARDWAVWTMERSPLPPYAPPSQVAGDMLQRDSLIAAGLLATLLCLLAFSWLRSARRALRSADESQDGKATIELKGQPLRVGRPVQGSIWLTQGSKEGELYRVELSCQRGHGQAGNQRVETAYSEELEVEPVLTPVGWSLPFSFAVPPIAPPSGVSRFMSGPAYRWHLAFQRSGGWISLPSVFALDLAPAPPEELGALEKSGRKEPGLKRAVDGIARDAAREPLLHRRSGLGEPPALGLGTGRQSRGSAFEATRLDRLHDRVPEDGARRRAEEGPLWGSDPEDVHRAGIDAPMAGSTVASPQAGPLLNVSPAAPRSADPLPPPHSAPNSLGGVTSGDAQARDTVGDLRSTDGPERAASRQPAPPAFEPELIEPEPAAMAGTRIELYSGRDLPLHERPEFRDPAPAAAGMFAKVVKWLFLVVFGGVLAVSAVALATAMLLRFVF